jgi:hypothetical protein
MFTKQFLLCARALANVSGRMRFGRFRSTLAHRIEMGLRIQYLFLIMSLPPRPQQIQRFGRFRSTLAHQIEIGLRMQ